MVIKNDQPASDSSSSRAEIEIHHQEDQEVDNQDEILEEESNSDLEESLSLDDSSLQKGHQDATKEAQLQLQEEEKTLELTAKTNNNNNNNNTIQNFKEFLPRSYYYVTYVPGYEIEQATQEDPGPVAGPVVGLVDMASAAVESSMADHVTSYLHHNVGGSNTSLPGGTPSPGIAQGPEPIFTSSDLPLQPYAGPGPTHNDLFINPAFAHMSFLSDGSVVGPNGEIYSPAEYFPSLMVENSHEVPGVIPVSPQPGEYGQGTAATPPPPGVGNNVLILPDFSTIFVVASKHQTFI